MTNNMHPRLTIGVFVLCGVVLSGTVHELGHAIAGKMAGLHVVYIQILPPALRLSGEPSGFWNAMISISGVVFSVLVGLAGTLGVVLLASRWPHIRYAVWLFVPMMAQALAWFCLPLVAVVGVRIPDGDIQKFIQQTKCPPVVVSLIGLMLVVLCVAALMWVWS